MSFALFLTLGWQLVKKCGITNYMYVCNLKKDIESVLRECYFFFLLNELW